MRSGAIDRPSARHGRFTPMVCVSALAHGALIVAAIMLAPWMARREPIPLTAYTVELTDPSALGGQLPPGAHGRDLAGGPTVPSAEAPIAPPPATIPPPPVPEPVAAPPEPPVVAEPPVATAPPVAAAPPTEPPTPAVEPPKADDSVRLPDVAASKPEPKPESKPEPKAEVKPEPKPAPAPKPPDPKPVVSPTPATGTVAAPKAASPPKAAPKADTAPARSANPAPAAGAATDAYAAAASRWRSRAGGGLEGRDEGSGPIGAGGEGPGGGGQLVGFEFLAYRQKVIDTIKGNWTHVASAPGLVARVRFEIASDGVVSAVALEQSAGNAAYDGSVLRAVQHSNPLPAPPVRYADDFRVFVIEFHSDEMGGQGTG